jgi:peptidoglycan hydrolase CwlO-like protein
MADKKKIIDLEVKTNLDKASGELDNFGKAVLDVDKKTTDLTQTFEDVYGDMKPLTGRMGELEDRMYELAQSGQTATAEFKDLGKEVGRLRKAQKETDLTTDRLARTTSEKLNGGIQTATDSFVLAQGAMSAFGIESKQAEESIAVLYGAMSASSALQSLETNTGAVTKLGAAIKGTVVWQKLSTAAQWLWNAAMSANPIGIVVVAVTALVTAGYALIKMFQASSAATEKATKANEDNKASIESQTKAAEDYRTELEKNQTHEYNMAKARGASREELRKLELQHIDNSIAAGIDSTAIAINTITLNENTLAALRNQGAKSELIEAAEANLKASVDAYEKENEALQASVDKKLEIKKRYLVEDAQLETDEREARRQAANERRKEEEEKKKEERAAEIESFRENLNTLNEIRSESSVVELEGLTLSKLATDETEQAKRNAALATYKKDKEIADAKKLLATQGLADIKGNFNAIESLAKEGSKVGKAAAIAQATISGVQGVQNAYTTAQSSPITVFFPAYPLVQAGLAAAVAAKNISAIKSGGQASGGGSANTSGGNFRTGNTIGPAPLQVQSSSFDSISGSSTAQGVISSANANNQPIQAFVTSTDIQSASALERNRIDDASF